MSGDADRSAAAAVELRRIKDAHLNKDPDPQKTEILENKPMQIPVGMIEVDNKRDALRDMKEKEADKWLLDHSVPYVEDYKDRKRPVDHHHEELAALKAGYHKVYTHRYLDHDLHHLIKDLPHEQFYAVTHAMGLFYDRDEHGVGPQDPSNLPKDPRGHTDDPFRSLAGEVRKREGYDKTSEPFAEFLWANYFRTRVKTHPTRADFEKAVAEAMALVHDPAARALPGYKPK